jgi:membrane-bound serine protease (ClpP class)
MNLILALIAGGFILLFAEIFLPGLIAGILGVLSLLAAVVVTAMVYGSVTALGLFGCLCFLGLIGFLFWMRFFPGSSFGRRLSLAENGSTPTPTDPRLDLIGQTGKSVTTLRPSGTALFHKQRHDVITEGSHIEADQMVKVVKIEGARMIVRQV